MKDGDGDQKRGGEAGHGGDVTLDAQNSHGSEEDDDRQGGENGGNPPVAEGIVALEPEAVGGVGDEEVDDARDNDGDGDEEEDRRLGRRLLSQFGSGFDGSSIRSHGTSQGYWLGGFDAWSLRQAVSLIHKWRKDREVRIAISRM